MKDFVTYEIALKLKEEGYPQDVFIGYDEFGTLCIGDEHSVVCAVPTISQVLKWLREKKKIFVALNISWCFEDEEHPFYEVKEPMFKGYYSSVHLLKDLGNQDTYKSDKYDSFEQAAIAGIKYVLDNLI